VGVVVNVSADHLGEYGIETVEDIAEVKLTLARVLGAAGTLVLKADDPVLMAVAGKLPHVRAARQALFARDWDHPALQRLRAAGGMTCGVGPGPGPGPGPELLLHRDGCTESLGPVAAMPLALGGAAAYNLDNIAAAVLAACALPGLPVDAALLRGVLQRFGADPADNPGRLERWPWRGATVLVDYAHNPDGLAQLLAVAQALQGGGPGAGPGAAGRLLLLLGQAGNRDDAAIAELARTAAAARPDHVVLKELPGMLRGRAPGEVPALLAAALAAAGLDPAAVARIDDELAAATALLQQARPGDVVVLPVHTGAVRDALAQRLRAG
jgi:UDP-N-acetylmuramyl tripeptide synthase